jgi:molybdopterin molybdotransferase
MNSSCCDHLSEDAPKHTLKNPDDAINELISKLSATPEIETIALKHALNRILAEDVFASISVPPEDNSAVDGYALHIDSLNVEKTLPISQRIPAGHPPLPLQSGSAARIFTGAHIPDGADCVVMQENTRLSEDGTHVIITGHLEAGQNIRPKGQDIRNGARILTKGDKLSPQRLGLLASTGTAEIKVYKPLKVAILSTGDELAEPGEELQAGQIYNSNRYLLSGFLSALGVEIIDLGRIPDNLRSTVSTLRSACQQANVVITTGGASVGEEDYIQSAIQQLGNLDFWKVAIKPGKPFMLGEIDSIPVLGLPGNPGAVFVTFLILARPFLLHLQGCKDIHPTAYSLPINFSIKKAGIRREFLRVMRNDCNQLELHPNQSSGMLSSASWADGLAVIKENTAPQQGHIVDYLPFESLI